MNEDHGKMKEQIKCWANGQDYMIRSERKDYTKYNDIG